MTQQLYSVWFLVRNLDAAPQIQVRWMEDDTYPPDAKKFDIVELLCEGLGELAAQRYAFDRLMEAQAAFTTSPKRFYLN
jgi:hypothetical protein